MARPSVSGRKPSAALAPEPKPKKVLDDLAMKTVTTAIRRDLWRELNKLAADQECTIQAAVNRAVFTYLQSENYTITVPLDD